MRFARHSFLLLALICILPTPAAYAGPGDTLTVQTFTFDSKVNPGWNAPREGRFFFPTADRQWERVLMHYTLKCDPSQNPACGEWDYLTYTRLHEHTGQYDSVQATHPNFIVQGATADSLLYMNTPSFRFFPRLENDIVHDDTLALTSAAIGDGSFPMEIRPTSDTRDFRSYLVWTSDELAAAGVKAEPITAVRFRTGSVDGGLHRLTVRLRRYTGSGWEHTIPLRDVGFVTVIDRAVTLEADSWNTIQFTEPFTYWSGSILAEFTVDRIDGVGFDLMGDQTGDTLMFTSLDDDERLYFEPRSVVDAGPMPELNNTQSFTLEAWINPASLRNWTNIVMKSAANENRVGIQLGPPESGKSDVYCLVGNGENSHGRTNSRPVAPNTWMHLAMVYDGTRNTPAERLRLYINGEPQPLTFTGTIPAFTAVNDARFTIANSGTSFFHGWMDEVRVWRDALTEAELRTRLQTRVDAADPLFGSLIAGWNFDDGDGVIAADITGAHDARLAWPQRQSWQGRRARGFTGVAFRPAVVFEQGSFTSRIETALAIDTVENAGMMVVLFADTTRANMPTDTLYVWPTYATYTFDGSGGIIDSVRVPADGVLHRADHFYYQNPFEILRRYELGRYITPYGIGLDLGEGWTWVYDVTDFLPLLKDTVHLTAGNFQELLDMKFLFIEGTPPRDVKSIQNLWQGDFSLRNFDTQVPPKTVALDPDAAMYKLRTTVTGHQFDNATNCAEFCPKIHAVSVDGRERWNWQIIQECSSNPLYPQGGTWIYARAGWCPGMEGRTQEFELTRFITGSSVTLDYNSDHDEFGNYVMESQLVSYGAPNHQHDAAVETIIEPSDNKLYRRFNPTCGQPVVVIQNRGAADLTGLDIVYGPRGGTARTFAWSGHLGFLEKDTVTLPAFDWGQEGPEYLFDVRVTAPNGGIDEYAPNDAQSSSFTPTPLHDDALIFRFRTNNAPYENHWELRTGDGDLVLRRDGFAANTLYVDTLDLLPGCYELTLFDSGEDGIAWWANNDGTGSFQIRIVGGSLWESLNPDFGKFATYAFRYSNLVRIDDPPAAMEEFDLYPNPADDRVSLRYDLAAPATVRVEIYNMLGACVYRGTDRLVHGTFTDEISTAGLLPGQYMVFVAEGARVLRRMTLRVLR